MRQSRTYGSVGAPGGEPPGATRQNRPYDCLALQVSESATGQGRQARVTVRDVGDGGAGASFVEGQRSFAQGGGDRGPHRSRREESSVTRGVRVDNGTEFTSKRLDQWAYLNGVQLDFSRRGKPTDNGLIEAFNGRLRAECLNENWFLSMDDARGKVESWRRHYNGERPHSALGYLAPEEFAASSSQTQRAG